MRQNDQGELIADFSDIGIPHIEGAFAVSLDSNEFESEGLHAGDIVLFDPGEPKLGSIVATEVDGVFNIRHCQPEDVSHVAGVAVGLIRRL